MNMFDQWGDCTIEVIQFGIEGCSPSVVCRVDHCDWNSFEFLGSAPSNGGHPTIGWVFEEWKRHYGVMHQEGLNESAR